MQEINPHKRYYKSEVVRDNLLLGCKRIDDIKLLYMHKKRRHNKDIFVWKDEEDRIIKWEIDTSKKFGKRDIEYLMGSDIIEANKKIQQLKEEKEKAGKSQAVIKKRRESVQRTWKTIHHNKDKKEHYKKQWEAHGQLILQAHQLARQIKLDKHIEEGKRAVVRARMAKTISI